MAASRTSLMRWIWRYGLAADAAVVYVWFVIGARQAHEEGKATALLAHPTLGHTPAVQRQARSAIDATAFLHLGPNVTLVRAQLAENLRDFARARQLID
jgi:ABC-type hemin transport system substrate-binding protein